MRQEGISYVEVLIAVALVAISLVPALESLQTALRGSAIHEQLAFEHHHLSAKLEEVLAEPFATLETEAQALGSPGVASSYSDAPGEKSRRLVFLAQYDGDDADGDADPFTGGDAGLVWVRVQIEATELDFETL
ncbi:MAG: type II secretion system protein, partial [bacterium]|nr:type II secretion system protein [bacterium]